MDISATTRHTTRIEMIASINRLQQTQIRLRRRRIDNELAALKANGLAAEHTEHVVVAGRITGDDAAGCAMEAATNTARCSRSP